MKTTLLFVLASLAAATAAQAQQVGIRAGTNYTTLNSPKRTLAGIADSDGRLGYQVSVFYERELSPSLAIVPELQFSRLRSQLAVENYGSRAELTVASYQVGLSYLSLPVMTQYRYRRFYGEIGPQIGLLLGAREEGTTQRRNLSADPEFSETTSFDRSATSSYQRLDAALCAGFGLHWPTGWQLGFRSVSSFGNATRKTAQSTYNGELQKFSAQVSVGYRFGAR